MNCPILRLDLDVWRSVARLLKFEDLRCLLTVGCRHLATMIGAAAESFEICVTNTSQPVVDLDCILKTAKATLHLRRLIIPSNNALCYVLKPLLPLEFPPHLTWLHAGFHNSLDFFLSSNDLAKLAPNLASLKLHGSRSNGYFLGDLKLPQSLSHLELEGTVITIEDGAIALLPRALTFLSLDTERLPPLTVNEWPLELSTLHISELREPCIVEHLPRTLTDLTLLTPQMVCVVTSFRANSVGKHFSFPWRRFFPHLTSLYLKLEAQDSNSFVTSVVSANAYDTAEVDSFLASGFWHSPTLDSAPTPPYPLFERIIFVGADENENPRVKLSPTLVPFLRKSISTAQNFPFDLPSYNYLPCTKSYWTRGELRWTPDMPKHFTHLWAQCSEIRAIEHFSSLEYLSMRVFFEYEHHENAIDCISWPPKLKTLWTDMKFSACALRSLPTNLTDLSVSISTTDDWSVLASYLVNLKSLSIKLMPDLWHKRVALAPIVSTSFEHFTVIHLDLPRAPLSKPFMDEFFGKSSPLPASLTKLDIHSYQWNTSVPLAVLPTMPPQLRALSIAACLTWNNPNYETPSHIASMTPFDLLASLPAGLELLKLTQRYEDGTAPQSAVTLASLPRGLSSFTQRSVFSAAATDTAILEIVDHLPPKLTDLNYDSQEAVTAAYLERRRPYLYRGLDPS